MKCQVKILDERYKSEWSLPEFATESSAGIDLRAALTEPLVLKPGVCQLIPTGLSVFIEQPGLVGMIFARSGLGVKKGIVLGNGTGVIDADYQGPLMIGILNRSQDEYTIQPGERVAQMVFVHVVAPSEFSWEVVEDFKPTERGEGGFGSSGRA